MTDRQRFQQLLEDANGHLNQISSEHGQVKKIFEDLSLHTQLQVRLAGQHHRNAIAATHKFHEATREIAELMPSLIG